MSSPTFSIHDAVMPVAKKQLRIAIIGAGMGGLGAALSLAEQGFQNINVYETASNLGFVGAGIQLAPNLARILDRLGCWNQIRDEATIVRATKIYDGPSERELTHVDLSNIERDWSHPHCTGHRATLAGSIYEGCKKQAGVKFHFGSALEKVHSFGPQPSFLVKRRDGTTETVECDVLLAADGVKSVVRVQMLEELHVDAKVIDTKQAAYRIMLKREQIQNDPELLELIDSDRVTRWIGEKKHIIAYPVASKQIYNISTAHPDVHFAESPSAQYTTRGSKADLLDMYKEFGPRVHKMLQLVPEGEVCEWKLRVHEPLSTWTYKSTTLIGDACHPTLPHLNQGAAQAIEDAAVISVVLAKCPDTSPESIHKALLVYEKIRMDRAYTLVQMAAASGKALQLGEGKAKEERDKLFAASKEKGGRVPDKWADAEVQKMIYGHDCMAVADEKFAEYFKDPTAIQPAVQQVS